MSGDVVSFIAALAFLIGVRIPNKVGLQKKFQLGSLDEASIIPDARTVWRGGPGHQNRLK